MYDILLLHGAIGSEEQLFPLRELLEKTSCRVHSLNFAGHGKKDLSGPLSIEGLAAETYAYIMKKKLEGFCVFGYSMGGYVALYLAATQPGLIKKIVTLGTKYNWSPEISAKEVKMLQPEIIEKKVPAFAEVLAKRHGEDQWKILLKATADMLTQLGNKPLLDTVMLKKISSETLLLLGEKDNMVSLEETINAAQQINNSSVCILPDTFHPIEQADIKQLSEKILHFFHPLPV